MAALIRLKPPAPVETPARQPSTPAADSEPGGLIITGVSKEYPGAQSVQALLDISLSVATGEFVTVLGPSGCGKSTLLNILAGFEQTSGGHVVINRELVVKPSPSRAVAFQEAALFPWLTVWDNITFGPKAQGKRAADYEVLAKELIGAVGLQGFEKHLPQQLSGGMKQRVGIARALIMRPNVLLMDEPFGALDAQTRLQMQGILLDVWEQFKTTVFFITHDIDEAILLSDTIYIMSARPGRIIKRMDVTLARPRSTDLITDDEFNQLRREIFLATKH
jgi:NitT/TauT family transport system ATP-binding protein